MENMLKIKEEFDYKSLSRRLEMEIDKLIADNERKQKVYENEIERIRLEAQKRVAEAERNYVEVLEVYLHTHMHLTMQSILIKQIFDLMFLLESFFIALNLHKSKLMSD